MKTQKPKNPAVSLLRVNGTISTLVCGLDREHLLEPPFKAWFLCLELCADECVRQLKRQRRSDDPRAQHEHIHVVVLHALVRRIGVVANPRANSRNLVRRYAHTHARSANQNSPRRNARFDRLAHLLCKVRIIVFGLALERSQVDQLVPCRRQVCAYLFLQRKSRMIRTDDELHNNPFSRMSGVKLSPKPTRPGGTSSPNFANSATSPASSPSPPHSPQ